MKSKNSSIRLIARIDRAVLHLGSPTQLKEHLSIKGFLKKFKAILKEAK